MDKLFRTLALDFPDLEDLVDEVHDSAQVALGDVPAFEAVLSYQDPSGPRLSIFSFDTEWTALPSLRTAHPTEVSAYRITPYIALVEISGAGRRETDDSALESTDSGEQSLRFSALSDSAFALPAGNPAGGEHRAESMDIAAIALDVTLGEPGNEDTDTEFSLRAPSTEEFYRSYKPRWVTPHAHIEGVINSVEQRHVELTDQDFYFCTVQTPFGDLALALPADAEPHVGQACSGEVIMVASTHHWPPRY